MFTFDSKSLSQEINSILFFFKKISVDLLFSSVSKLNKTTFGVAEGGSSSTVLAVSLDISVLPVDPYPICNCNGISNNTENSAAFPALNIFIIVQTSLNERCILYHK